MLKLLSNIVGTNIVKTPKSPEKYCIGDIIIIIYQVLSVLKFYSNNKYILWKDLTNNILPWFWRLVENAWRWLISMENRSWLHNKRKYFVLGLKVYICIYSQFIINVNKLCGFGERGEWPYYSTRGVVRKVLARQNRREETNFCTRL